jgi:hypothetical protein
MKKLFIILSLMIFSGLANAADAPVDSIPPVSFNIGGEVVLEGLQISKCEDQASAADVFANELDDTDDASITADLVTLGFASGTLLTDDASYTFDVSPCGADNLNETFPHFSTKKKLTFDASATLYNGLQVAFSDELNLADIDDEESAFELSVGGAFGTVLFKDNTSAVDSMLIGTSGSGADTDITLTSDGHIKTTSGGDGGINVVYFTPSFAGMDLALGYNHNTDNLGLDNSEFKDTISVGFGYETYIGDVVISLGGGVEKASSGTDTPANCLTTDEATAESATSADTFFDGLYGSSRCGNETLSAIGADLALGNYTISSAYSSLDTTDGGDTTVWSVGLGKTINDTDYTIGYTLETLDYAREKVNGSEVEDQSKILMLEAVRPIGEGIDLGLNISNAEVDNASQELGNGVKDAWRAGVSLTLGF